MPRTLEFGPKMIKKPSYTGSIVLKIVYGYTLQDDSFKAKTGEDEPYIRLVLDALEGLIASTNHGSFMVDYLPILKHVPGKSGHVPFTLAIPSSHLCLKKRGSQELVSNEKPRNGTSRAKR